jgi:hypothetical protein
VAIAVEMTRRDVQIQLRATTNHLPTATMDPVILMIVQGVLMKKLAITSQMLLQMMDHVFIQDAQILRRVILMRKPVVTMAVVYLSETRVTMATRTPITM